MQNFLLSGKTVPRWVILLIDLSITILSFSLSYFVVKQFEFAEILRGHFFFIYRFICLDIVAGLLLDEDSHRTDPILEYS